MKTPKEDFEAPSHCQLCKNRGHSAFHNLGAEDLDKISALKSCVSFKKGQVIMNEGSRPQGVYCIHKGKAKVYRVGTEGKEQVIRFATNGDLIGYRSILSDEPISASISAMDDTYACYIPKSSFFQVIEENSKFSLNVLKLSCHELGEAGKMIASLAQKTVRERLAEILLVLRATFGEDEEGYIDLKLTREEIANMVGTATESAIRLISELKDQEYISTQGKRIKLLDRPALRQIAGVFE
ncbi:Crp/Fnr family transcriptional regulator [Owenweeksia hongkongensis]|uniref:Crp/Fnr family transcriptional regulator n=1 Tax=Owenweeksia hongkongensis TaxID=253245 RepID=UPI003A8D1BAA